MNDPPQILSTLQQRWGPDLDSALRLLLNEGGLDPQLAGMMSYQLGYVDERLQPVLAPSGKRFRPLMCLLVCEAVGGGWRQALTVAAAIELLHNFSLIHDDIEDHDPARRHRPTVWKVWGEPCAINAGDAMFALASRAASRSTENAMTCLQITRRFQATTLALTAGQYLDMSFEDRLDVAPEEYLRMIEHKTGALIALSAWAGAAVAGKRDEQSAALQSFGLSLGKAFQIQDDLLGIWASPGVTGKEQAKDLANRKKTLPVLLAARKADRHGAALLREYLARRTDDLDGVMSVLDATGVHELCEAELRSHLAAARAALNEAGLEATHRADLESLAAEITRQ